MDPPYQKVLIIRKIVSLHGRHNGCDGVSNHQGHGCLLKRLFRRCLKKTAKPCAKCPETWKMFPFDDVTMGPTTLKKMSYNVDNLFMSWCLHEHGSRCMFGRFTKDQASSWNTVYPKKYAHGFVVLCFVVVMQSFIMNSHEVFIHIHQGYFAGTGAIVRLPQCQWSGKISQCITTT